MRKFWKILTASLLIVSMVVTPVLADEVEEDEEVRALREQVEAAQGEVDSLQAELTTLLSDMAVLEQQLIDKGEEIAQAQKDLEEAEYREQAQYSAMKLRIKYMYESGDASLVDCVLSAEDMSDALNKAEYANEISNYDRTMINKYIETQEEIKALKKQLEKEQADLEELQAQYVEREATLNKLIEEKQAEVAGFNDQLDAAIKAAAERAAAEEAARAARESAEQAVLESGGDSGSVASTYCGYNAGTGNAIVDAAYTQLGVPYVWGGTTPYVALDCSGLVQYCYRCAGISIPRTSAAMVASGTVVSDPQPGDICWTPGHVAVYIGGGQMIEAQQSGVPVCVSAVRVAKYLRFN